MKQLELARQDTGGEGAATEPQKGVPHGCLANGRAVFTQGESPLISAERGFYGVERGITILKITQCLEDSH